MTQNFKITYIYIYILIIPFPAWIHGEMMMVGTLTPSLSNWKLNGGGPAMSSGFGTPSTGVGTWS